MHDAPRWYRDPVTAAALVLGLTLRALPLLLWGWGVEDCTRDECIYRLAGEQIAAGEGFQPTRHGWLPAPGYPFLLAWCATNLGEMGTVKWLQWALTVPTTAVLYGLGARVGGRRTARLVALGFAVHPTFAFYVGTLWTETVYTFLLAAAVLGTLWARDGGPARALVPGALLGLTVLFRGVATTLLPVLLLALVAPPDLGRGWAEAVGARARHALLATLAAVAVVGPYSAWATQRFGGFVISDATAGHVAHLGNNDYPPVTFDYGIGQLTAQLYARTQASGRRHCPKRDGPVAYDRCERAAAAAWIRAHPATFLARVPVRLAQLLNPHSFLTRHVRWRYWPGLPWAAKEAIVTWQMLTTLVLVVGGTAAAWARARGPLGLVTVGVVLAHVGVIAALYGLTRFRLPLEPLWLVFLAAAVAHPRATWGALTASRWRLAGAALTVPVVVALSARYAWTGYPGFGP